MEKNKIVIGTRGSVLALAQAEKVKEMLETEYEKLRKSEEVKEIEGFSEKEKLEIELKIIVTTGDKDFRDFSRIQGTTQKDLFVKEIEKEVKDPKKWDALKENYKNKVNDKNQVLVHFEQGKIQESADIFKKTGAYTIRFFKQFLNLSHFATQIYLQAMMANLLWN